MSTTPRDEAQDVSDDQQRRNGAQEANEAMKRKFNDDEGDRPDEQPELNVGGLRGGSD